VNRFLVDALVEAATDGLEGETALDLYAGVGLFSMALAKKFAGVAAVESGWSAYRDLEFNVQASGAAVTAVHRTTEEFLAALETAPDAVIADPPRAGLGKQTVAELARLAPRELAIVSCDPATLARDLAGLLKSGYEITKLTLVDLFPHTFHIETVARLRR
jgi:23S rRNA (uracil1939-C5)-methyltransferase